MIWLGLGAGAVLLAGLGWFGYNAASSVDDAVMRVATIGALTVAGWWLYTKVRG